LSRKSVRHKADIGHLIFNNNLVGIQTSNWTPFQFLLDGRTMKKGELTSRMFSLR